MKGCIAVNERNESAKTLTVINARSRGCPITGYLSLDTHVIRTSITRALVASFALFPRSFQNLRKALHTFSLKRSSQKTFLIQKFVIDMINW